MNFVTVAECGCVFSSKYHEIQEGIVVVKLRYISLKNARCNAHNQSTPSKNGLKKNEFIVLNNLAHDVDRAKKNIVVRVGGVEYFLDSVDFDNDRLVLHANSFK